MATMIRPFCWRRDQLPTRLPRTPRFRSIRCHVLRAVLGRWTRMEPGRFRSLRFWSSWPSSFPLLFSHAAADQEDSGMGAVVMGAGAGALEAVAAGSADLAGAASEEAAPREVGS